VQQEDKVKFRNVKVIPNEECVSKHKLLVMDIQFNTTQRSSSSSSFYLLIIYKQYDST